MKQVQCEILKTMKKQAISEQKKFAGLPKPENFYCLKDKIEFCL